MMYCKKISLYVANHGRPDGIEDYLANFEYMFTRRGFEFQVSMELEEDAINLVIDEFTNFATNRYIAAFAARSPNTPLVFVLTEFIEERFLITSFNNFDGLEEAAKLVLINYFLRTRRPDFPDVRTKDYLRLALYFPVLLFMAPKLLYRFLKILSGKKGAHKLGQARETFIRENVYRDLYMHARYLGMEAMITHADAVMAPHKSVEDDYERQRVNQPDWPPSLGMFYLEFPERRVGVEMLANKENFIEMTGSITTYRKSEMGRINGLIKLLGLANSIGSVRSYGFGERALGESRAAFSIHPPQVRNWPYCSPTRIYRALVVDQNIPILTKNYGQHPIEDLCLLMNGNDCLAEMYEMLFVPDVLENFLDSRVGQYLEIAEAGNDLLCKKLVALRS